MNPAQKIKKQKEWGKHIYELTDYFEEKLTPKGYTQDQIAQIVARRLIKSGYTPRRDIYALFSISYIREIIKIVQDDDIDILVRWHLDVPVD